MSLLTSLIAYWKTDESSGDAVDATGNGHTLTNSNVTYGTGKINNGAVFDSTTDQLSTSSYSPFDFERTDPFSFSLWMKIASDTGNQFLFSHQTNGGDFPGYSLYTKGASGGLRSDVVSNSNTGNYISVDTASSVVPLGSFAHIVYTYDGSSTASGIKIYVNGSLLTLTVNHDALSASIKQSNNFVLGNRSGFNFAGTIDEIGVWSRELTSAEVSQLYNAGAALAYPFPAPPVVDTLAATGLTTTGATLNGEITDIGGSTPDERGFVWDTGSRSDPGNVAPGSSGYANDVVDTGSFSTGTFDGILTGLTASSTYYARAYAHNADGYVYGDEVSFTTSATPPFRFTNIEGVTYDPTDTQTIYAERLNDILERLEALEG